MNRSDRSAVREMGPNSFAYEAADFSAALPFSLVIVISDAAPVSLSSR
jgi:hypothetical protein